MLKGPDRVMVKPGGDEIQKFIDASYTSASQAEWEIQGNPITQKDPNVVKLPCHLENEQFVLYSTEEDLQGVVERCENTMLTEFFKLNREDPAANFFTYLDIIRYYR